MERLFGHESIHESFLVLLQRVNGGTQRGIYTRSRCFGRRAHLIAPQPLRPVHRLIGLFTQLAPDHAIGWVGGNAQANRCIDPTFYPSCGERESSDGSTHAFSHRFGLLEIGLWQHDHEFFPTIAPQGITSTQDATYSLAQLAQYYVADSMSIGIVDVLETVCIKEDDRQGVAVATRPVDLL